MKEFMPLFASITTAVATLGAVYLTQIWNRKTQKDLLEQQLIREEVKEKRNELKETLEVYNQVLKIDGEFTMVIPIGGPVVEFNIKIYEKEIRSILYGKYHLLHDDVAESVSYLDDLIKMCQYYEEITREDHCDFCERYSTLIRNIKQNIYKFRKGDIA
ncbi:hypothetical protein bmyco0002_56560 [Bacillus pseudomycoides]|uniref:hypothetical protein n=1 Tax=Bacillus pseudomycoides TaxID=64104 RepID=UPI0001A13721|nr:hypothetical protein [Bacillus pseudomycoides]EEM02037.1 hypothetical protein bmyco0002_56560 [Bacillus pseudomycoides]